MRTASGDAWLIGGLPLHQAETLVDNLKDEGIDAFKEEQ